MKKTRKILIMMMITIFTMTLFIGCGKKSAMGRYEESDLKLPEGINYITEFKILENGDISVVGNTNDPEKYNYYTSNDNGENWTVEDVKIPEAPADKSMSVRNMKIKNDGSLFIIFEINGKEQIVNEEELGDGQTGLDDDSNDVDYINSEYRCVLVDKEGNSTDIKIDNTLLEESGIVQIDTNGDIYIDSYEMPKIIQLDGKTGAIKKEYLVDDSFISSWAINDKSLLIYTFESLIEFNIETGKKQDNIELDESMKSGGINVHQGKNEGMFYFTDQNGVYSYKIGKKSPEKIIDGTLSTFGDTSSYLQKFVQKSDEEFIATFSTMEGKNVMKMYKYNSQIPSKPENEISIYSLYESDAMREAVIKYQKANQHVYINLKHGMSYYDESADVGDAIKKINTEIIAGKGPDIILLDELPAKSYIEKGILEDITDIVEKDNLLIPNIISASKSNDGKVYSIPLKFFVPTIIGEGIEGVNSLSSLAASIEEITSKSTGSVIDVFRPDELVYLLYKNSGDAWVNDNKTINTENLKKFLEDTKKIYDSVKDKHSEEKIKENNEQMEAMKDYKGTLSLTELMFINGGSFETLLTEKPTTLTIHNFSMAQDLRRLEGYKAVKEKLSYDMWRGQDTNTLIGANSVAINAKSNNKEIAKDFVKSLLTEEYQNTPYSYGFSVNKEALKSSFVVKEEDLIYEDAVGYEVKGKNLSEDEINDFIAKIETFDSIANPDIEVLRKTIDEFTAYISGSKSIDDTIKAIENKLEIYLAE